MGNVRSGIGIVDTMTISVRDSRFISIIRSIGKSMIVNVRSIICVLIFVVRDFLISSGMIGLCVYMLYGRF